jgi:hypothetical protein
MLSNRISFRDCKRELASYLALRPPITYTRTPATLVNADSAVLKGGAKPTEFFHRFDSTIPERGLATLADVTVYGRGPILVNGNALVKESFIRGRLNLAKVQQGLNAVPETVDSAIHISSGPVMNYGHFLLEMLPRLLLHLDLLPDSPILIHETSYPFAVPMLRQCGIDEKRVMQSTDRPMRVGKLYWPTPNAYPPLDHAPEIFEAMSLIRSKLGDAGPADRLLFLSRRDATTRMLLNDAEIFSVLEPLGFEWVHPGRMRFEDQVRTFSRARVLIGASGAACTNCVFMPPGGTVIVLSPASMASAFFWDICWHSKLDFVLVFGENAKPNQGILADFRVPAELVRSLAARYC